MPGKNLNHCLKTLLKSLLKHRAKVQVITYLCLIKNILRLTVLQIVFIYHYLQATNISTVVQLGDHELASGD
jgi:hypothetical protein